MGASACAGAESATRGSVRIVLVDAFTGRSDASGSSVENSLQLEIDALNAHGGLLGRRVELVSADNEAKADKSGELVREHLADERVGLLVGPGATTTYSTARPFIDHAHVPNCLPARVADDAVAGAAYTFRTHPADRTAVTALLGYVRGRTAVRKLGGLAARDAGAQAVDKQLGAAAAAAGIEYVGSVSQATTLDARTALQQLLARGAQGVVLAGDAAFSAAAARALQDLGVGGQVPVFGFDGMATLAYTDQAADAAQGTVVAATRHDSLTPLPSSAWPAAYRNFMQAVAARYGYAPNGQEVKGLPQAADCVVLWARAVRRAGTFDGQPVVRAWEQLDVRAEDAALGVEERFAPGQHDAVGADGLLLYQWVKRSGQYRLQPLRP